MKSTIAIFSFIFLFFKIKYVYLQCVEIRRDRVEVMTVYRPKVAFQRPFFIKQGRFAVFFPTPRGCVAGVLPMIFFGLTGRKSLQLNKSSRRSPWHLLDAFSDLQCLSSYNCVSSYELSPYMCKSLKQNHCLFDRNNWKSMCVNHLLVK